MATEYAVLTGPLEWVTSFVSTALWTKLALAALLGALSAS